MKVEHLKLVLLNILIYVGVAISFPNGWTSRFFVSVDLQKQLISLLVLVVFNIVYCYGHSVNISLIPKIIDIVFSVGYAFFLTLARAYQARQDLSLIWQSKHDVLYTLISVIATALVIFYIIKALVKLSNLFRGSTKTLDISHAMNFFVISFCILTILWLPYFIGCLPGIAGYDGMYQIDELFRAKVVSGQFTLTNHHPIFSTLVEGLWLKIGISAFHSINIGILLNSIFLNLITIASFSYLSSVTAIHYSHRAANWLLLFYGLFPVFPLWANVLDKTGYFNAACVFFIACLMSIIRKNKLNIKDYSLLGLSAVLLGLIRNDGFLYVLLTLIGSFTLEKEKSHKVIATLFSSCIIMLICVKTLTFVSGALPTEPMESLAIPLQSVTRVVNRNPNKITKSEKQELNKFFSYNGMRKNYDPEFADVAKSNARWPYLQFKGSYKSREKQFNDQQWVKNKSDFLKLWLEIGKRNPKLYLEAIVGENYYYFYPQNAPSHYGWGNSVIKSSVVRTKLFGNYHLLHNRLSNKFSKLILGLSSLPIINLLFLTFIWFITWAFLSLLIINKQQYHYLTIILVGLSVVVVSLVSPLNGFLRYYFPLMIIVPVLFVVVECIPKRIDSK